MNSEFVDLIEGAGEAGDGRARDGMLMVETRMNDKRRSGDIVEGV